MNQRQTPNSEPRQTFEWTTTEGPSTTLVSAVSTVAGVDPLDMEQLYEVVDPDSLDTLFNSSRYNRAPPNGSVQFEYLGYWVVIKANGRGYVYDEKAN